MPKVREPNCLTAKPGCTSNATSNGSPSPTLSPSAAGGSPSPSPTSVSSASPSPTTSPSAQPDLAKLESTLTSAPEISDSAEVDALQKKLYGKIDKAWKTRSPINQDLVYRVGVDKNGAIVGYKPVNPAALKNAKQTPLLDLLALPAAGSTPSASEPLAQYKVVFTSSGVLEVAPWKQAMASPLNKTPEITDSAQLKDLQQQLYDQIDKSWKEAPTFEQDLVFRVRVKSDGTVLDYKPDDQNASDYVQETLCPN